MKNLVIYILLILSSIIIGQEKDSLINNKKTEAYINGIKYELGKVIIYEKNIKKIEIIKPEIAKKLSSIEGKINIIRKRNYRIIELSDLIGELIKEKEFQVILNEKLIDNISEYKIEENPKIKINIQHYSDDGIYHGVKPKPQILIKTKK